MVTLANGYQKRLECDRETAFRLAEIDLRTRLR